METLKPAKDLQLLRSFFIFVLHFYSSYKLYYIQKRIHKWRHKNVTRLHL